VNTSASDHPSTDLSKQDQPINDQTTAVLPSDEWLETLEKVCASHSPGHPKGYSVRCTHPLLTMFTSMDDSDENRSLIHSNTIINWALLGPCVTLVLYVDNIRSAISHRAHEQGWTIEPVPLKRHGTQYSIRLLVLNYNNF